MAHATLQLRAAHRALLRSQAATRETWALWDEIVLKAPWNILLDKLMASGNPLIVDACQEAKREALNFELGPAARQAASTEIRSRLMSLGNEGELPKNCVLIGGPPCQAYSIVGRSRNKGIEGYKPEKDQRHFLYREYLSVIAEFAPAVFVMENVKGILTSKVDERRIFDSILRDLKRPKDAIGETGDLEYVLLPLPGSDSMLEPAPEDFLVRAEDFGIPQARHRVIILGVRKDVYEGSGKVATLESAVAPTVRQVIEDLPRLHPQISHRGKGKIWKDSFEDPIFDLAVKELLSSSDERDVNVAKQMVEARRAYRSSSREVEHGNDRKILVAPTKAGHESGLADWFADRHTLVLSNHQSRAHMPSDLVRYLFAAAFGEVTQASPKLLNFPRCLLPEHRNVDKTNPAASIFKDRFRVQVGGRHSMTVTSHIAKDGHAFIHPDKSQCRSLTVREAARLQTFPDSYVFLGNRTSQYTQVGNAVPPLLARKIADIVGRLLTEAGLAEACH